MQIGVPQGTLGYPLRADADGNCEPEPNGTNKAIWADEVVRYLNARQGDIKELGLAKIQFNVVAPEGRSPGEEETGGRP